MAIPLHKGANKVKGFGMTQLLVFVVPVLALAFEVFKYKDSQWDKKGK